MSFLFSVTTTKSLKIFNLVLLCIRSRNRWIVFSITKTSKNLSRVKSFQKRSKFKTQRATSGSFVNVNWSCWSSGRTRANCIRVTTSASYRVKTYSPPNHQIQHHQNSKKIVKSRPVFFPTASSLILCLISNPFDQECNYRQVFRSNKLFSNTFWQNITKILKLFSSRWAALPHYYKPLNILRGVKEVWGK